MLLEFRHVSEVTPIHLICTALNRIKTVLIEIQFILTHSQLGLLQIYRNLQPSPLLLKRFLIPQLRSQGFSQTKITLKEKKKRNSNPESLLFVG